MKLMKEILLPGTDKQIKFLLEKIEGSFGSVLVIGSGSEEISRLLAENYGAHTEMIVEDYDSLLTANLVVKESDNVHVSLMDFALTDFGGESFDLIYAQASISLINRNKIVKELKRLLKPDGILCVGEFIKQNAEVPRFVQDIFDNSGMLPMTANELVPYYRQRGFSLLFETGFTKYLKDYYAINSKKFGEVQFTDDEKKYYKKLINKISHETNAYMKLGADKHIGFHTLILRKSN